jgi:hypothetical protein
MGAVDNERLLSMGCGVPSNRADHQSNAVLCRPGNRAADRSEFSRSSNFHCPLMMGHLSTSLWSIGTPGGACHSAMLPRPSAIGSEPRSRPVWTR